MDTMLETAKNALDTLLKMPAVLLFALALNVLGWVLKRLSFMPNRFIPLIVVGTSAAGVPFLIAKTPTGEMSPYMSNPDLSDLIRRVCIGLLIGFIAWGLHKTLLARAEKWLTGLNSNGDTQQITKPKNQ